MGTRRSTQAAPRFRQRFHQIDMRDWLTWLDPAHELALAAGREHRRLHTITTSIPEALARRALCQRMIAEGLHKRRGEPLFRAAKSLYFQTETEPAHAC